ncbi:hypothetical protein D3C71_1559290 [compost metagenome]
MQQLLGVGIERVDQRLDQLPMQRATGAGQDATVCEHAKRLIWRKLGKSKQLCVEMDPVLRAAQADVLHHAKQVQALQCRRARGDGGNGHKVHVVD